MPTTRKNIFSILIIGSFLLMALASEGPDGSTNTTVQPPSNCESKPPKSGPIHIFISYRDNNGIPIPNAAGTIFITHEATINSIDCRYTIQYFIQPFTTDSEGNFGANGWDFTHTYNSDVYRVEVLIKRTATHTGWKGQVQAKFYDQRNFDFICTGLKRIDL